MKYPKSTVSDDWYDHLVWWKKAALWCFIIMLPFIGSIQDIAF